jgi:hypothetical protein
VTGIDPTVIVAAIAVVGVLATAGGTLFGVVLTRGTETKKLIAGAPVGFQALVNELQEERAADRAEITRLLARDTVREEELSSMRVRMRGLEVAQDTAQRREAVLLEHIRDLRTYMRAAGLVPPPAPPGSGIEDSGEHVAVVVTGTPV